MSARTRVKGHRTGQRAALEALALLVDAGCATNELTGSDYGFDIHALLPEQYPETTAKRWAISAHSVHVQVKGGASFNKGVSFTREMWRFYVRSPVPVYVAVVPAMGDRWIELADRLADVIDALGTWEAAADAKTQERRAPDPGTGMWNPRLFTEDAVLQSALGDRRKRRLALEWACRHLSEDADTAFFLTLGELAVADTGDYHDIDSRVDDYLQEFPRLAPIMQ